MKTIADYQNQRDAFQSLLDPAIENRILLFKGPSGIGKTLLIRVCQKDVCKLIYHVPIQLRGTAVGIAEILWRVGNQLGWDSFQNFTERLSLFSGVSVNIERNRIRGSDNQIKVVLQEGTPIDRDYRQAVLTDALFADFSGLNDIFLLLLDTYEQATTEVKSWISGPFLQRVANNEKVRVAIAGQEIPDHNTIEWGDCCEVHELYGVREAKYWLPVVEALKRKIPVHSKLDWLAGICHALDGRPDSIMKIIQRLPQKT